jgi:hypothetical protein
MPEPHKDRRVGLIAFGVLQLILGVLTFVALLSAQTRTLPNVAQTLFLCSAATVYFVASGIGSIRGRRTARALIAAVSGAWTVVGVLALTVLVALRASSSTLVWTAVLLAALPLALTLFYSSRDTALTADELDPQARWTDRAPVPVLALCAVLAFSAVDLLMTAASERFTIFGRTLTGPPAALAGIALSILLAYVAIQAYRLREYAWWVLLLLHLIGGASSAIAFSRSTNSVASNPVMWTIAAAGWLGIACFLIWLRRYFVRRGGEEATAPLLSTST